MDESRIDQFVDNVLTFNSDGRLQDFADEVSSNQLKLAASGYRNENASYKKIGALVGEAQDILVKIFDNRNSSNYELLCVSNSGESLPYLMLQPGDRFKLYTADHQGRVIIPKADNINPLEETFSFSKVKFLKSIDVTKFQMNRKVHFRSQGYSLVINWNAGLLSVKLIKVPVKTSITKLLAATNNDKGRYTRIVSLINNRASLKCDFDSQSSLIIGLFA